MQFIYAVGGPFFGIWLEDWLYRPNEKRFIHECGSPHRISSLKDKCGACKIEIPPGIKLALLMEAVRVGHIKES